MPVHRYTSDDEDSGRWTRVALRDDDVVVSTRSKHGTTWVQAILLLLVHGPDLPAAAPVLSPWVDHLVEPIEVVAARLERQRHRRVLKTHTPLDGLPDHPGVHHVVVARHPLDAAVSLYHQGANIDRQRLAELTGRPTTSTERPDLATWMAAWVRDERDPRASLDSLPGVAHHLTDAWGRRDRPGVTLVHYADLLADPTGQVARLARRLDLPRQRVPAVVEATRFDAMRARSGDFVPDGVGVLRDHRSFFRSGRSGAGREVLGDDDLATYERRMARRCPVGLLAWLHR